MLPGKSPKAHKTPNGNLPVEELRKTHGNP